ncbi:hypothetical protein FPE01S_01_08840 [Flavihumibacter petaseus NBRC 106054]|uniref:Uncharacterized protein n=2 Tax=Flavihumibacter TaxID=1004301 RepID=A0A0E9MWC2_9BACT|nr:hypothetical protein FPE01S_01_08840 [Flavihumibacter petaseus NBRC 106054]
MAEDLWKKLGITEQQGMEKVRNSFLNGYLEYYGIKNLKSIAAGDRAAVTSDLLQYAKKFSQSADLKKAYGDLRENSKPVAPVKKDKSEEEIRKEQIAELETSVKNSEETIKKMPDMEKVMRPTIDLLKQTIEDYKKPGNTMIKGMYQYQQMENDQRQKQYEEDVRTWEEEYPEKFELRLKSYLTKYLELAKTVDFSAKLEEKYGKKRFVNPQYEGKSSDWKMIFRAGPEVQSTALPFAEQWLKELK